MIIKIILSITINYWYYYILYQETDKWDIVSIVNIITYYYIT